MTCGCSNSSSVPASGGSFSIPQAAITVTPCPAVTPCGCVGSVTPAPCGCTPPKIKNICACAPCVPTVICGTTGFSQDKGLYKYNF